MKQLLKTFLKNYDPQEKGQFLTARFVLIVIICAISATAVTISYSGYLHGLNSTTVLAQAFGFIIMLVALGLLVKGNYMAAIHILFMTGFATIWTVMFIGSNQSIIIKMDTVVYIVGLLAAIPIASRSRKPMLAYFFLNIIIFLLFNYHLKETANLTFDEHLDYLLDNSVVMVFVVLASLNISKIRQKALSSLQKELDGRRKAEKDLLESQHRFSSHLENTPVGAISWDLDFAVVEWNPSAEVIFGYSRQEVIGKNITALILPEDRIESANTVFQKLLSDSGKGKRTVNENITKSGRSVLCEWYNTVLKTTDGKIIGVASLVNDITERKKTQEMIIQSEKMMSVGGLAAGMAHEINNPLAGIMQNAQIINNRLTGDLPANKKAAKESETSMAAIKNYMEKRGILNHLEHINQAGQRVAQIIENMLSFSKKSDLVRREVNLAELIENTIELVKNDYRLKKKYDFRTIEIVREYSPNLPTIFCEKSKIQQVLFNLFKNASEAMASRKYENESPKLILRLKKGCTTVHIEVEDNGAGMDTDTRNRVFEPFFSTKGQEEGTGLGLSISYFIVVDDHGGQMSVDSTLGKGTLFTVKLPFRSEKTNRK